MNHAGLIAHREAFQPKPQAGLSLRLELVLFKGPSSVFSVLSVVPSRNSEISSVPSFVPSCLRVEIRIPGFEVCKAGLTSVGIKAILIL
jgi:hypothetical protein